MKITDAEHKRFLQMIFSWARQSNNKDLEIRNGMHIQTFDFGFRENYGWIAENKIQFHELREMKYVLTAQSWKICSYDVRTCIERVHWVIEAIESIGKWNSSCLLFLCRNLTVAEFSESSVQLYTGAQTENVATQRVRRSNSFHGLIVRNQNGAQTARLSGAPAMALPWTHQCCSIWDWGC